ncbi:MAG: pantetheine-phosphate adenylyltransferase [Eubacteriaceae bacterium]|nr:pantetheine-phosphate adenylyltransferase [Eubacteriaceae bacterium]
MSASVLYAGSFDPVTNGHIDVIRRAVKVFGGVRVVLMVNSQKNYLFDLEERVALLKESLGGDTENIEIDTFNGLLVDYCEQNGIYTVVRGLRAMTDFDYEFQMALTNRRLNRKVESVMLIADANYTYLSSSTVKEVARYGGDISFMVPSCVEKRMKEKHLSGEL